MEISSRPSSDASLLQPRTLALLVLLAVAAGFAAVRSVDQGGPVSEELQALSQQSASVQPPLENSGPPPQPRSVEDYIRVSGLIAYDVAAAARIVEHDSRGDLFDCYVSMFLPPHAQSDALESIRKAIALLEGVPEQDRDYRYHIKMAYSEFYRFVLIPVVHQREQGEQDLTAAQLREAGESFDAALFHAGQSGDALSEVFTQLQAMSSLIQTQSRKYDPVKLNEYFRQKQPLIRQIL